MSLQQRIAKLEMKVAPWVGDEGKVGICLSPREAAIMIAEGTRLGESVDPADMLYLRKIDRLLDSHSEYVKRYPNAIRPLSPKEAAAALLRAGERDDDAGEVEYILNRVSELYRELEETHNESCATN